MAERHWLDDLARGLAGGASRREALRFLGASLIGVLAAPALVEPPAAQAQQCRNPRTCGTSTPCCPSFRCESGTCQPLRKCSKQNPRCPAGTTCCQRAGDKTGTCIQTCTAPKILNTSTCACECPAGTEFVNGTCVQTCTAGANNCPPNNCVCSGDTGHCVQTGFDRVVPCSLDTDCQAGQRCVSGVICAGACGAGGEPCPAGQQCHVNYGCVPACNSNNADCSTGYICSDNACVPACA